MIRSPAIRTVAGCLTGAHAGSAALQIVTAQQRRVFLDASGPCNQRRVDICGREAAPSTGLWQPLVLQARLQRLEVPGHPPLEQPPGQGSEKCPATA